MRKIFQCLFSPRLFNLHRNGPTEELYKPNIVEQAADTIISIALKVGHMTYFLSPFVVMYLCRRDINELQGLISLLGQLSCALIVVLLLRGYGRSINPQYVLFLRALKAPKADKLTYLSNIRNFDFEFSSWPATYESKVNLRCRIERQFVCKENMHLSVYRQCIVKAMAYVAVHTFGLRLIYPGTLGLIHYMLNQQLLQGRAKLVDENDGLRTKIKTADGNFIDTMFVDNRNKAMKGRTLVICCEGNSGFYEVGIMDTPMRARYSVLGWNHPGFAASTGLPYPSQELCAMDAVMQFAVDELGFSPANIVLFGWSIGGYSAAWAAANYRVGALILDATFDDLLPLALRQMPASWAPLVREVVRSHVNLDVAAACRDYTGPLHLVRRTADEILCLTPGQISTNRGNQLLIELIQQRHQLDDHQVDVLTRYANMAERHRPLPDEGSTGQASDMLRLINKYSSDFRSTHCTPLTTMDFENILRCL